MTLSNSSNVADYGKIVELEIIDDEDGSCEKISVTLVDDLFDSHSNSAVSKITVGSPLGQAIYKKPIGHEASYEVNGFRSTARIVSIN